MVGVSPRVRKVRRPHPGRNQRFHPVGQNAISYQTPIDESRPMSSQDVATLSSKFQISIPKSVRTAQKWQPGQKFAFIPRNGGVILVPIPRWEDLVGSMQGANTENYRDRNDRV